MFISEMVGESLVQVIAELGMRMRYFRLYMVSEFLKVG